MSYEARQAGRLQCYNELLLICRKGFKLSFFSLPLVFLLTSLVLPWSYFALSHSAIHKAFLTALSLFPELQAFAHHGRPLPRYQVALCFGEEFPDPQRQRKLITAHVSRTCAFAEQNVFLGGYESARQAFLPSEGGDKFLTVQDHQDWG